MAHNLRIERYNYVKRLCDAANIQTTILADKKVRNRLTHIDEHLVKALRKPNTGWLIDCAIAYRDQFTAPSGVNVEFCRTFIVSEETIVHLDAEINVPRLHAEATSVLSAVFGNPTTEPPEPPTHSRQAPPALPQRSGT
jgi:hypothetical protein